MRPVPVVRVLLLLLALALLCAAPVSAWAAPTITWYKVQHVTTLSTDMSGNTTTYWTRQIGVRVHSESPDVGLAAVTITVDGATHWNCSNRWPANDGTGDECFCTTWDEPALPAGGPYTLSACDWYGVPSEAVVTPALTRFLEPAPEVIAPAPGGVTAETSPTFTWLPFPGFAGENAPPVNRQGVGVSGDSGCLWRQCDITPGETSAAYAADPLLPGQIYWTRVWEFAPDVPLEGAVPGIYAEQTGRVWAFAEYSPVPAIQTADICRARCLCSDPGSTEFYHEGVRISALDYDGWQDLCIATQTPDGLVLPCMATCGSSTGDGRYTLAQANAHDALTLGAGSYTIIAVDPDGNAATRVSGPVSEVPPMHQITYPTNGAVLLETELTPTFTWAGAPGAAYSCICVKDRGANGAVIWTKRDIPGDVTSIVYNDDGTGTPLSPGGRYRVHVRVHYADEDPGDGVAVDTFTAANANFRVRSGPLSVVPIEGTLLVSGGGNAAWTGGLSYLLQGASDNVTMLAVGYNGDISPLGDQVVYLEYTEGEDTSLWRAALDGSNRVLLTGDPPLNHGVNCPARWSPDGTRVAFQRAEVALPYPSTCQTFRVWVLDVGTGQARQVSPDALGAAGSPEWRPDGRLGFSTIPDWQPWVIDPDGSDLEQSPVAGPWSPDGSAVVWDAASAMTVDGRTGYLHELWKVQIADGSAQCLASQFVSDEDIQAHLQLQGIDPSMAADLAYWVGPHSARWSPKGDRVVFAAAMPFAPAGPHYWTQNEAWVYDLASSTMARITDNPDFQDGAFSWRGPNTYPGRNVAVPICDVTTTFASVSAEGLTTSVVATAPAPPAGFVWLGDAYHITTTATVQGAAEVAVRYHLPAGAKVGALRLLRYRDGDWADVTGEIDAQRSIIRGACPLPKSSGDKTDLSIFAVALKAK